MSESENEKKGNLDITVNYVQIGQDVNNAIYFLQKFKDRLDTYAIERGLISRNRRKGDRRNNNV